MSTKETNRAILTIGYVQFVMDAKAAAALFPILTASGMELFEEKWNRDTSVTEPYIMPIKKDTVSIKIMPNEEYAMGKLLYAASLNVTGETK